MTHANWQERLACQRRWRRENRAKVRAQKRRARMKKKCLSKSLVVVLDDYRKRMSTPVTKTLVVVLEDYRLKKIKKTRNELRRDSYRRNGERIRAREKGWRQRNLKKCRAQSRASSQRNRQKSQAAERQKEYRQKNRDALNERRRKHRRQHRDVINRAEREYRRKHRETYNQKERVRYWMKRIATRAEVPTSPCDCGLCLACGGFETESWSRRVVVPRSDPLEAMERRLDQLETAWSDTSSEVDPALEKELERVLNETSSDEASESEEEEEDVVEQRLASLRRKREEDMTQGLARWEREEAVTDLSAELGGIRSELRDIERWFEQFHREDEAQPNEYTQTLMVTSNLMNELERFLFLNK